MYNRHYTKPKPIIEKIELTEAEKADIQTILKGLPNEEPIRKQEERGVNVEMWIKHRRPETMENRIRKIRKKYNLGLCHICSEFAYINVTYKMDGIILHEYFCERHKDKIDKL